MGDAKLVLVFLGPTGIGKTSLIKQLAESRNDVIFLSSGESLWKNGVLQPWTETSINEIKQNCYQMITKTFEKFASSRTHRILCLDCIKDLEDAEYITAEARRHGYDIYRAVFSSFDSAESMANTWKNRRSPALLLPKQPEAYLQQWRAKFSIVLNYYRRPNVLSFFPGDEEAILEFMRTKNPSKVGEKIFPICASGNHIRFLLINSVQSRLILDDLLSLLKLTSFEFSFPVSIVHNARDVSWVADATRYHVTLKAEGARFLLLKIENDCFLVNSNQEVFPCDIDVQGVPDNTILEGKLLASSSFADIHPRPCSQARSELETSVFLVSDVLVFSRQKTWGLPLSRRLSVLNAINIDSDIPAALNNDKATRRTFYEINRGHPTRPILQTKLPVRMVLKEHRPSTATDIESLLLSSNREPFCGLIFTPETSYSFGPDSLSFEWQPEDLIRCSIKEADLKSGKRPYRIPTNLWFSDVVDRRFPLEGNVIECKWDCVNTSWVPLCRRYDKQSPDSDERIDLVRQVSQQLYDEWQLRSDLHGKRSQSVQSQDKPMVLHPAVTYEFNELYSLITQEVDCDRVQKHTDPATKLEVFNRSCPSSPTKSRDNVVQLCEALVLHPESKTVVTKSFVSFFADSYPSTSKRDDLVEATVKFDGSLGVAFLWKNRIRVATKQGMNTMEALAAESWIKKHCKVKEFRKGFSYVFEILSQKNMAIMEYPFEGLVLLSITNADGLELGYDELLGNSQNLGFSVVSHRIHGRLSDVLWYCGGSSYPPEIDHPVVEGLSKPPELEVTGEEKEPSSFSGALPKSTRSQEGWVVRFQSGIRMKLVDDWWIEFHTAAKLVHPQIIWLLIKYNKLDEITEKLPHHFKEEVHRITNAFGKRFLEVLMDISKPLEVLRKFFDHIHSVYLELHSKLNEGKDELISGQAAPKLSRKDNEKDIDNAIRLLTTQFFQALQVFDEEALEQPTVKERNGLEPQAAMQQPEALDRNNENTLFDSTNQVHCFLRDAFENSSEDDKTKLFQMFQNFMSDASKDGHFLNNLDSPIAKLPQKVLSLILKAYEEIFSSVCPQIEHVPDASLSRNKGMDRPSSVLKPKSYGFISLLAVAKDVKEICHALSLNELFFENNRQLSKEFNISPFYTDKNQRNDLRIPILNHIKPTSPAIDYYQPSSDFTVAKQWEAYPLLQDDETKLLDSILTSIHGPSIILQRLPNEMLLQVLEFLDASHLVMASRVCRKFHEIITHEKTLEKRISEARLERERLSEEVYESSSLEFYSQDSYS